MKSLVWRPSVTLMRSCWLERDIVALADVVERKQFDHQMMHAVAAGLDQGQTVMPRVDVEEKSVKRLLHVVAEPESPARRHRTASPRRCSPPSARRGRARAGRCESRRSNGPEGTGYRRSRRRKTPRGDCPRDRETKSAADAPVVGERARLGRDFDFRRFEPAASASSAAASATSQPKKRSLRQATGR